MAFVFKWVQSHAALFWWVGILSVLMFFGTLVVVPVIIVKLPADYFISERHRPGRGDGRVSFLHAVYVILKNLAGAVFVLAGIAMLFLPGQGILTLVIGVSLLSIPNKRNILAKLVSRRHVLHSINRFRARFDKPPLLI